MGQVECLKELKKNKWQSTKMLMRKLNQKQRVTGRSLKKLFNQGLVLRDLRKVKHNNIVYWTYFWKLKWMYQNKKI